MTSDQKKCVRDALVFPHAHLDCPLDPQKWAEKQKKRRAETPTDRCELNNPELLQWARERADLTPQQMAGELMAALDEHYQRCDILAAESGDLTLTEDELRAWAEACETNFGALFLPEPPEDVPMIEEHREEIVEELEYIRCLAYGGLGALEAVDIDLLEDAIKIIRDVEATNNDR